MSTTTNTNGRARKSLADQLDRLDCVLGGLADNLNEAVAAAVREAVGVAVKEAVQAVLAEVLANPAVLAKLGGAAAARPTSQITKPGLTTRIGRAWGWVCQRVRGVCQAAATIACRGRLAGGTLFHRAHAGVASFWARMQIVRHFRVQLLTALAVGVAAGTAAYYAGPWLAAGVSAARGFATTLAVQAGWWLRRTIGMAVVTDA